VVVDVVARAVLAQVARPGPYNDCATLRSLIDAAHAITPVKRILADAEFDSERNHQHIRQVLGAHSVIPAKRGCVHWQIKRVRAQMRKRFPRRLYAPRAQVESVFSTIKRKLAATAPGRSVAMQRLQILLLGITYNHYLLKPCPHQSLTRMPTEPTYLINTEFGV
jgi:hypothetical protein